jgi:putative hydrolase of the HAD superfamily
MKIKVVCFDIDGTLYPKWITDLKLVRSFFPSPLLALRIQRFREHMRREEAEKTIPPDSQGFRLRQATWVSNQSMSKAEGERVEKMARKIEKQFYANWRKAFSSLPPYAGMRGVLETLRSQGVRIAALSDFPIGSKLEALKVDDLVEYAICTEESGYLKPHPEPFLMLCEKMDVEPIDVLYVGDSCRKDMFGASRVGMKTALIDPSAKRENRMNRSSRGCQHADMIFSNYSEFMERLEKMLQ